MAEKNVIRNIGSRVAQLIESHRKLSSLCSDLQRERDALKAENRRLQEQVKVLENELSVSRLSQGFLGEGANRDKARARVNRLMREIDKCIALLGGQK